MAEAVQIVMTSGDDECNNNKLMKPWTVQRSVYRDPLYVARASFAAQTTGIGIRVAQRNRIMTRPGKSLVFLNTKMLVF